MKKKTMTFENLKRLVVLDEARDPLLTQFRKWAKKLLRFNPEYVLDAENLIDYIKGRNWDDSGVEYAHYKQTVAFYGKELLDFFEKLRELDRAEAIEEYNALLKRSGIEDTVDECVKKAIIVKEDGSDNNKSRTESLKLTADYLLGQIRGLSDKVAKNDEDGAKLFFRNVGITLKDLVRQFEDFKNNF